MYVWGKQSNLVPEIPPLLLYVFHNPETISWMISFLSHSCFHAYIPMWRRGFEKYQEKRQEFSGFFKMLVFSSARELCNCSLFILSSFHPTKHATGLQSFTLPWGLLTQCFQSLWIIFMLLSQPCLVGIPHSCSTLGKAADHYRSRGQHRKGSNFISSSVSKPPDLLRYISAFQQKGILQHELSKGTGQRKKNHPIVLKRFKCVMLLHR